jgi:L-xylulokinase
VARSPFWCQVFADGLGRRVEIPRSRQLGALGAAICAGVGARIWPSIAAAQRNMTQTASLYEPDAARQEALTQAYERCQRLAEQIYPDESES